MVSPWLLLVPGAAAVYAAVKPPAPPRPLVPAVPVPQIAPGVPDTPKTRAYAEAVAAVEFVRARGGSKVVFNGVSGWMADRTGRPMYPILSEKDLPAAPPGYRWSEYVEPSGASRSAHTVHHWHLGPPPKGDVAPQPLPAQVAPGVLATQKTIAYRNALLLKQQVEAKAKDPFGAFAAVFYSVSSEAISESELPPASPGFRWTVQRAMWQYVGTPVSQAQQQIDSYVRTNACIPRWVVATHGTVPVPDEVWNALKAKGWTEFPAATGSWAGVFSGGPILCPPGKKP